MKKHSQTLQRFLLFSVLAIYVMILCKLLLFKSVPIWQIFNINRRIIRSININPFYTVTNYLSGSDIVFRSFALSNVFGNIVLFIPLGIYLPLLKRDKRINTNILWVFLISLSVEIAQYIFGLGISDIEDIILNCSGGFIGIITYKVLLLMFKEESKVRFVITITAPIIGFLLFFILFWYNR